MKYLCNISRTYNCWNRFRIKYAAWDKFIQFYFLISLSHAANNWKSLNHEISHVKKKLDPRKSHVKKWWILEIPTRKYFDPTKHPQNINEKKFWTHKTTTRRNFESKRKTFRTHETPTRARWHAGTWPTTPTMACEPRELAHSPTFIWFHWPTKRIN